jgi:hypothetical protein
MSGNRDLFGREIVPAHTGLLFEASPAPAPLTPPAPVAAETEAPAPAPEPEQAPAPKRRHWPPPRHAETAADRRIAKKLKNTPTLEMFLSTKPPAPPAEQEKPP